MAFTEEESRLGTERSSNESSALRRSSLPRRLPPASTVIDRSGLRKALSPRMLRSVMLATAISARL